MTVENIDEKESFVESEEAPATIDNEKTFARDDILVCFTHGNIYAIYKLDGNRIWKAEFPSGAMGSVVSLFLTENYKLIVGANGKTCCMNLMNGQTIWINKMQAFGNDEVFLLITSKSYLQAQKYVQHEIDDGLDLPPYYNDDEVVEGKECFISYSRGKVMGIDIKTGDTLWTFNCPGGRFSLPVAITEYASIDKGKPDLIIYIGAGQWIYCLKVMTDQSIWSARISEPKLGLNYMTLATPWSSRLASEAYSVFSPNPVAQVRSMARHREKATP